MVKIKIGPQVKRLRYLPVTQYGMGSTPIRTAQMRLLLIHRTTYCKRRIRKLGAHVPRLARNTCNISEKISIIFVSTRQSLAILFTRESLKTQVKTGILNSIWQPLVILGDTLIGQKTTQTGGSVGFETLSLNKL